MSLTLYSLIQLDVKSEIKGCTNSMYAVVPKEKLDLFIKSIYFFIMENNLECMLNEKDISVCFFSVLNRFMRSKIL